MEHNLQPSNSTPKDVDVENAAFKCLAKDTFNRINELLHATAGKPSQTLS